MKNFIKMLWELLCVPIMIVGVFLFLAFFVNSLTQSEEVPNNVEAIETETQPKLRNLVTTKFTTTAITSTTTTTTTTTEVTTTFEEIVPETTEEPVYDVVEPTEEVIEETEVFYNNTYGISDEEYRMFVLTVYLESGNQSYECKQAVASVIMNRVYLDIFPNSVYEVLTQEGQFTIDFSRTDTPDPDCYRAVDSVLSGGSVLPIDVKYFFATYCTDSWLWSRPIYTTIGDVVFAY